MGSYRFSTIFATFPIILERECRVQVYGMPQEKTCYYCYISSQFSRWTCLRKQNNRKRDNSLAVSTVTNVTIQFSNYLFSISLCQKNIRPGSIFFRMSKLINMILVIWCHIYLLFTPPMGILSLSSRCNITSLYLSHDYGISPCNIYRTNFVVPKEFHIACADKSGFIKFISLNSTRQQIYALSAMFASLVQSQFKPKPV